MKKQTSEIPPSHAEQIGWLVELGCSPPMWWTGRSHTPFSPNANAAIRFARREDAECAIAYLVKEGTRDGCKATEHLWGL